MLLRRARGLTMIFEQQYIAQPPVIFQIVNAFPKRPQNLLDCLRRQIRNIEHVIG